MHTSSQLIRAAKHFSIPLLCGVSSERDFQTAISSKVDAIKVYPSRSVPPQTLLKYINEVSQQPYRIPPIIVAGSVTTADFIPYILAGADNFIIGFDLSTASVEYILSELKKLNDCLELARKTVPSTTTTAISRR
jgi:2-keto-3-deoxy-6-phosphogluconate aldolase